MQHVYPNYYGDFSCIKGDCRHSCCIGWEIDVDGDALRRYDRVEGDFGDRLRRSISREGEPHFQLLENEQCPFLNGEGLCDMILALGEDSLCDICREHPRFHNALPGRVESGLGLCCEAAARLIIGQQRKMTLVGCEVPADDEILVLRDRVIAVLQDRTKPISARIAEMTALCGGKAPERITGEWTAFFLSLERLDEDWTRLLRMLAENPGSIDLAGFDGYMEDRQTEYEQLAVYLVYRHFANSADPAEVAEVASFVSLGYELIRTIGAFLRQKNGKFDFEDQIELVRLFSSEIEYCEENVEAIKDHLRMKSFECSF